MLEIPEIKEITEYDKNSDICIVIPTYNQFEITKNTIIELLKQSIKFDIVIIDNASTDNSYVKFKKFFKEVNLILCKKNYGGSGALFIGQKYAFERGYQYIILSDNDAIPIDSDLIEEIVKNSDKNHIVDFINSADSNEPDIRIFHYGCFHRDIISKVGYVDWRFFIYGDDIEYALRLKKFNIKRKKIYKRYWHPMKYHYPINRVYFDIRNELENGKIYPNIRKLILKSISCKKIFFCLYEKNKFRIFNTAICDWINRKWDNNPDIDNLESDISYNTIPINTFLKQINNNNTVVTYIKLFDEFCPNQNRKFIWYTRKYIFPFSKKVLVTNQYFKAALFYKEIYYITYITNNEVSYFKLKYIPFYKKILPIIKSIIFYFKLKNILSDRCL